MAETIQKANVPEAVQNQQSAENTIQKAKAKTFSAVVGSPAMQKAIMNTLQDSAKTKTFTASLISAVTTNPNLQNCDASSIVSAALLGESLKLSPSPQLGHYYMVPYKNKASFQLGYKGYIQLAIRSGQYKRINVVAIKQGELESWNPMTEEIKVKMIEDDNVRENTPTIGYYASFETVNGFTKAMYWSKKKMEQHARKYSKGYSSFWGQSSEMFDTMAFKTMLRQLISKWGIMSIDLQKGYVNDYSVHEDPEAKDEPVYYDNPDVIDAETGEVK